MEILFVTPHGSYALEYVSIDQTMQQILIQNHLPHQSMSIYGKRNEETSIILGMHQPLKEWFGIYDCIIVRPDRNINYSFVCNKQMKICSSENGVAEYTFSSQNAQELLHFELNEKQCRDYVAKAVLSFLQNDVVVDSEAKIVIGVSGGGDSNTLIEAFLNSGKVKRHQIMAVMMLGIPDWDLGKSRAESICNEHKVELQFVTADHVSKLLGKKENSDWVEDFEKCFPDADLEILGTLGVRLALKSVAKKYHAQAIVTGLNLEDVLAESLLAIMQGKIPFSFPVRIIDELPLWYPLYKIPKKILDGCHPKFSLANYNDRYPSKMAARAIPYYVAQMMHTILPGIEFDLLKGFKEIVRQHTVNGHFENELGFSTVEALSDELKNKWLTFQKL